MNDWLQGIRAIFFDAVGTILFPIHSIAHSYRMSLFRLGIDVPEEIVRQRLRQAFGRQEQMDAKAGWITDEAREYDRWYTIVAETLPEAKCDACFHDLYELYSNPQTWRTFPQIGELLQKFHQQGLTLGLASNFDARLNQVVEGFPELALLQERCLISSLIGARKPGGHFFQEVIRQAGCAPHEILYVGDDLQNDYHGARAAGLRAVLLDPSGKELSPDIARIASLQELA